MPKNRQASSTQQQRRAAKARLHEDDEQQQSSSEASQPAKSFIVLRSSLPPGSFIPAVFLQVLAVAYCILLLHGRPSSLLHISALLRPLVYSTNTALLKTSAGLLLVQLYLGIQLKLWSDRSEKPNVPTVNSEGVQEGVHEDRQAVPAKHDVPSLHKLLLKVDLSRLDLSVGVCFIQDWTLLSRLFLFYAIVCTRDIGWYNSCSRLRLHTRHTNGCTGS